jgi:hypothetical protein
MGGTRCYNQAAHHGTATRSRGGITSSAAVLKVMLTHRHDSAQGAAAQSFAFFEEDTEI